MTPAGRPPRVAVIVPCLNEESTIEDVVERFRQQLPEAQIVVADNGSRDRTADLALRAGARVLSEPRRGKGNAVRTLLQQVDADLYLMVDGDSTYDPEAAAELLQAARMPETTLVLGTRATCDDGAYRRGHMSYNRLLRALIQLLFGRPMSDPLTGYRCLTRQFADDFPARAQGFTTEIEMDLFALEAGHSFAEVPTHYRARPADSASKLKAFSDGSRILAVIAISAAGRLRIVYGLSCLIAIGALLSAGFGPIATRWSWGTTIALALVAAVSGTLTATSWLRRRRWHKARWHKAGWQRGRTTS
jgi:glycosyltransferase involved in cell wall biosynthesis